MFEFIVDFLYLSVKRATNVLYKNLDSKTIFENLYKTVFF